MRKRYAEQNRAGLAALEGQRRQYHSAARLPVKSARQVQKSQGRLQLPDFLFKEWPRGFDSRLSAQWGGKPAHSTVPVSWFREDEDELVEIIKRHIGNGLTTQAATPAQKFAQGWRSRPGWLNGLQSDLLRGYRWAGGAGLL